MNYPVVETFYSIQGEGFWSGAAAFFVRLFGCPVKCPWCDTRDSWEGGERFRMEPGEIAAMASLSSCEFAVITGGEPTIHPLEELVDAFHFHGIKAHLETSGFMQKNADFDWITVSPKLHFHSHESYLEAADELKFVVSSAEEIAEYMERFAGFIPSKKAVYFNPEASHMGDAALLSEICETVKLYGKPFRAGFQAHKIYLVD